MTTAWQPVSAEGAGSGPLRFAVSELAARLGGRLCGRGGDDVMVGRLRPLDQATARDLSFVHAATYLQSASASAAGAFLVAEALDADAVARALGERPHIVVASSQRAVAQVLEMLFHLPRPPAGVHATAVLGADCEFGEDVVIGPFAVVGDGCRLGDRVVVEAHAVLGRSCTVGTDSWLHAACVLYDGTRVGARVRIHSGTVLGGHGFGYTSVDGVHHKTPQVGCAVLGDDVEVGINSAIDRALVDETRIGSGTKIDNLVQVAHNVQIGRGCILCGQAGIAGSASLGDQVVLSGQVGVSDHTRLGDQVQVAAGAKVLRDVEAGQIVGGASPVLEIGDWRKVSVASSRLPELLRRVKRLERRLEEQLARLNADPDTDV